MDYYQTVIGTIADREQSVGSGGAAALVAAIGTALCRLASALPAMEEKYAGRLGGLEELQGDANALCGEFLSLSQKEAATYRRLQDGDENAAENYCIVLLELMRQCHAAIDLHDAFAMKGAAIDLPDVGVGVLCCRTALQGACLILHSVAGQLGDRNRMLDYIDQANELIPYTARADEVYVAILGRYP